MKKIKLSAFFSLEKCEYIFTAVKWLIASIFIGLSGGIIGFFFVKAVNIVTNIRANNNWLIFLLPIGGLIIPLIYTVCKTTSLGTNDIFKAVKTDGNVSILLLPSIFISSVITHLLGGSAGREGAALQIGGSMASFFGKIFKLGQQKRHILIICGMASVFSSVFCTPLAATVFAVEVVSVGYLFSSALLPSFVSSVVAYFVSTKLGTHPERFLITNLPKLNLKVLIFVLTVSTLGALVSIFFCKTMHHSEHIFEKYIKNKYLRIAVGGIIIIILSLIFSSGDYNGGGMNIVEKIFSHSEVKYEAFLLKIIFTAITIGAGYKGGEIVPTIFIGATFGATVASVFDVSMAFGAGLGIAALFCGVTNCPLATLFLCIELFGADGILYFALSVFLSFVFSGYTSLYKEQNFIFSKITDKKIEIYAK